MGKEIEILAEQEIDSEPDYWFIGGLRYGKGDFSPEPQADIEYPYTTYYTTRIHRFTHEGTVFVPLSEINLPLIVLEYGEKCLAADIEPVLENKEGENIHHFIGFDEKNQKLKIIRPEKFRKSSKEAEWLGTGTEETIENPEFGKDYELEFREFEKWQAAVEKFLEKTGEQDLEIRENLDEIFQDAENWLYRSWDEELGTFLQLPWREGPGFALDEYSYSLLANEAVRLNYFDQMSGGKSSEDQEFRKWVERLKDLFKNEELYMEDPKHGQGLVWYNTATYNGEKLTGEFYLGTGHYGYPGGQSTKSLHLLKYLINTEEKDRELEELVEKNLKYILSTQKDDGHWPAALKNEMELPFKKNEYYGQTSEGATGESVRALIQAHKFFGDEKYREAAIKGLEALETQQPICKNGLRDIGTDEVEAFSAFSIINAFIDAYEHTGDEKYLEQVENYSLYLSTWLAWFSVDSRDIRGVCHPISETITMRISPYETVITAKTFLRVSNTLEGGEWDDLADLVFKRALESINDTGGMSEGIFYDFEDGLKNLETEQTFATTELLYTLEKFSDRELSRKNKVKQNSEEVSEPEIVTDGSKIEFPDIDSEFDLEKFGFTRVKGEDKDQGLVFRGPYSRKSRLKSRLSSGLRRSKFLMAPKDLSYIWTGIKPKDLSLEEKKFSEVDKEIELNEEGDVIEFEVSTGIYNISGTVKSGGDDGSVEVDFSMKSDTHDVLCEKVLLESEASGPEDGYLFKLENSEKCDRGFDLSRKANWTHAGIYQGTLKLNTE